MDENTQHTEEDPHSLIELQAAMSGRIVPLAALQRSSEPVLDDLSLLQRDLGKPRITPARINIGRLCILFCGHGWMKVELLCPDHESEAELLPPADAAVLKKWIAGN
ncbi:MAG: hypothetical protein LLF76_04705 [Planctomycetaceae bacterium]|nr:hypothetical protein [Planctomycetaceae bacterium]